MRPNKKIVVESSYSRAELEEKGCYYDVTCDTLKEAKQRAKDSLTIEFKRSGEMSEPYNYARIVVYEGPHWDRKEYIHSEFWRKGYSEPIETIET